MIVAFIACLLLSFVMVHIDMWAGATLFTKGFKLGVICWVGFIAPPLFTQHIFEGRRANLFAINARLLALGYGARRWPPRGDPLRNFSAASRDNSLVELSLCVCHPAC